MAHAHYRDTYRRSIALTVSIHSASVLVLFTSWTATTISALRAANCDPPRPLHPSRSGPDVGLRPKSPSSHQPTDPVPSGMSLRVFQNVHLSNFSLFYSGNWHWHCQFGSLGTPGGSEPVVAFPVETEMLDYEGMDWVVMVDAAGQAAAPTRDRADVVDGAIAYRR